MAAIMATLFLSYSRRDTEFVRRLHGELVKEAFDLWVDWEGIPPADDWLRKIHAAIEGADAMVFVISPDSLASPVCHAEVTHAVQHHKRLLPVVARDCDAAALSGPHVHEAVRRLNWIFFNRPQDTFDAAVRLLAQAVRTDLPWVETHTRLLQRALEWQASGRDDSYLLVKTDLAAAEQWLASAADKEPSPTQPHSDFIVASRSAATRRQRRRTLLASTAAVLVSIGALVATWQFLLAELRRQDSLSRQLAAVAPALLDNDPALGLLLAAQAVAVSPTHEASNTLLTVLERARGVRAFLPGRFQWGTLASTADGSHLAAVRCTDGEGIDCRRAQLEIWQSSPPVLLASAPVPTWVERIEFSPDDRQLAVLGCCVGPDGHPVERFTDGALHRLQVFPLPASSPASAAPAELVATSDRRLAEDQTPQALWPTPAPKTSAPPPGGLQLAVDDNRDGPTLTLWRPGPSRTRVAQLQLQPGWLHDATFRQDSRVAAAWACQPMASGRLCQDMQLGVIDASEEPAVTARYTEPWPDWISAIAVLPGVPVVLSAGCARHDYQRCGGGELRLWQARRGESVVDQPRPIPVLGGGVQGMALSADARSMALLSQDGLLSLWQVDPQRLAETDRFSSVLEVPPDPSAKPGAPAPAITCGGEPVPTPLMGLARRLREPDTLCAALAEVDAFHGKERTLLDPQIATASADTAGRFAVGGCVDVDGPSGTCRAGRIAVWSVAQGQLTRIATFNEPAAALQVALSADGKALAASVCKPVRWRDCSDARVLLWRPDAPATQPLVLASGIQEPTALQLSANAGHFAVARCQRYADAGGADRPCALARIEWGVSLSDATRQTQSGHASFITTLAFNADGRLLASGDLEGGLGVWDLRQGEALGPVVAGPPGPVGSLRFSTTGARMALVDDETAVQWPLDPTTWRMTACRLAMRPLSSAERDRYLRDDSAPDACQTQTSTTQRLWRWLRGMLLPA